jgi:small subunit ribosomal protein S14
MKLPGIKKMSFSKTRKRKVLRNNSVKKRAYGKSLSRCTRCGGRKGGKIGRYGLNICRRCFREVAQDLGFTKYR